MWNKKYNGYCFKSICDELEVAFKPHHKFSADLGGYAKRATSLETVDGAWGNRRKERTKMTNELR
jgi:hypothetical protein